jgi:hypothetical protein
MTEQLIELCEADKNERREIAAIPAELLEEVSGGAINRIDSTPVR